MEEIPGPSGYQPKKVSLEEIQINKPDWTETQYKLREFALDEYLQQLTSRKNCISVLSKLKFARFSAIPEFGRLVTYVAKYPEPGKTQLASLLFPTFVHLYILLLQMSRDDNEALAQKFHASYASTFYKAEGYEDVLKELKSLKDIKAVIKHPFFKNFREQKCVFGISISVFKDLVSFINKMNSSSLLYVFHLHFHFEDESIMNHSACDDCMVDSMEVSEEKTDTDRDSDSNEVSNKIPEKMSDTESVISEVSKEVESDDVLQARNLSLLREEIEGRAISFHHISLCWSDDDDEICSLDFAIDKFQLCVALRKKELLCIKLDDAPEIHHKSDIEVNMEDHSDSYKMNVNVSAVKYIPHEPDELLMAVGKTVVWYSLGMNKEILVFEAAHDGEILDIDVNSSGTYFVTVGEDASACVFNFKSKRAVRRYIGHLQSINAVRFHPNGEYFVTGSLDFTARLWTVEKDLTLRSFIGHNAEIYSIACANNGKIFASADALSVVRLWDIEKNCVLAELFCNELNRPEKGSVTSLCFNDDSSRLLACNVRGIVKEWNVKDPSYHNLAHFTELPIMIKYDPKRKVWILVAKKCMIKESV